MAKREPSLPQAPLYSQGYCDKGLTDVISWDVLRVVDGEILRIKFLRSNSESRQGIWLKTDNGLTINGVHCPSAVLWKDTSPPEFLVTSHTNNGLLHLYNVWDSGRGIQSQSHTSGMRVNEVGGNRTYACNDIGFDSAFDKLVFAIERT